MRMTEYKELVIKAFKARLRVLGVGKPGVGKTQANMQAMQEIGADLIVLCLPLDDPSTIRGYPVKPEVAGGEAVHCLFDGMAKAFKATKDTLLFFDDIGQASESTLKAVMRIIQFGELDGRKLPECVRIGGATNDVGHGAGVYGLIEPLKSRFHTIVNVEANVDDVVQYGLGQGWPPWLLAYLRNNPEALNDWKPCKSMAIDGACPRGWEYLATWDNTGIEDPEVWQGCVGKGQAAAALAFKGLVNELPDIDGVLIDPDNSPVPENPSAKYLISMALASKMDGRNFGQAVKYLQRLPAMFRMLCLKDAMRSFNDRAAKGVLPAGAVPITKSRDFTAWAVSQDAKDLQWGDIALKK